MELPDFHIPHAEKIEWMIETNGWALEPVAADPSAVPPRPGYAYSIGLPDAVGFPDVAVFGLTPVAANGLVTLVADARRGGTEIPFGVELIGLLDNDLRCVFAPIVDAERSTWFATALAWYAGAASILGQAGNLRNAEVTVNRDEAAGTVTVTITGNAPAIIPFGSWGVTSQAQGSIERFIPADER